MFFLAYLQPQIKIAFRGVVQLARMRALGA